MRKRGVGIGVFGVMGYKLSSAPAYLSDQRKQEECLLYQTLFLRVGSFKQKKKINEKG